MSRITNLLRHPMAWTIALPVVIAIASGGTLGIIAIRDMLTEQAIESELSQRCPAPATCKINRSRDKAVITVMGEGSSLADAFPPAYNKMPQEQLTRFADRKIPDVSHGAPVALEVKWRHAGRTDVLARATGRNGISSSGKVEYVNILLLVSQGQALG